MAQDRSQSAREGQAFLRSLNLGDAAELVFDRVFNRDDLVFVGFNLRWPHRAWWFFWNPSGRLPAPFRAHEYNGGNAYFVLGEADYV